MNAEEWKAKWPNHCRACRGWGAFTSYQSVPYGSTSASFPVSDPCDDCTFIGKCARCGELGLKNEDFGDDETGDGPCKFCGWNYDDGEPDERPDLEPDIPDTEEPA